MNHRLFDRFPGTRKKHDRRVRTICQECSVRCGLIVYLQNGAMVDIHGDDAHPVSRGRLCARGLAFIQGLDSPDRITSPAFRHSLQDPFEPWEDWEKALDGLAEQLRKIKDQHGAESIIIACDPDADLDFAIGAARFAALIDTPHVYPPLDLRQNHTEFPWLPCPVPPCYEWGDSRFLFFIEADPATTHPVAFGWALEAQQQGAKLIVADSRFTRTMSKADLALRILPGSGNVQGLALTKIFLERSDYNDAPAKARFINPETWRASFDRLSFEDLENTLGLSPKGLKPLSDLLSGNHPTTIVTGKALAALPTYGIWPTLMTALGCGETKGSGWVPLAGTTPPLDPTRGLTAGVAQKRPHDKEDPAPETIQEPREMSKKVPDTPRAILYWGDCLSNFFPFPENLAEGLELMACFGAFPDTTQGLSQMIFPSTLWPEKNGLCFSNDRAIQWAEKIVEPRQGCRTGLDFWSGLAKRFGWSEAFPWTREDGSTDQEAFYQWVFEGGSVLKGCTLDQLRDPERVSNLCFWSAEEGDGDRKIEPTPAPEILKSPFRDVGPEDFPFTFQKTPFVARSEVAGPYWPWTRQLEEEEAVQINPETAQVLNIENGDVILISSPAKIMEGRAWISRLVPRWMVASPRSSGGDWVLVHKVDQTSDEALNLLREWLP